jgi:hypothetical protein
MLLALGFASRWTTGLLLAGGLCVTACNADPEPGGVSFVPHCSDANGDATCVANYPNRPWCSLCVDSTVNQGCVAVEPVPQCSPNGGIFPGTSGNDSADPSTTTSPVDGSGSESVDDTTIGADSTSSTGTAPCELEGEDPTCADADPSTPYCAAGRCVSCLDGGGDDYCAGSIAAETPACDAAAGSCVACDEVARSVCGGISPVCGDTGACVACTEHAECPDTACHLSDNDPLVGACFEPSEVIWVDTTAICPGLGTEMSPSCSLNGTLGSLPDGAVNVIKLVAPPAPIQVRATASGAFTVAIVGVEGVPVLSGDPTSAGGALVVGGSALAYVHNLRLNGNPLSHGLTCTGAEVWLTDSEIRGNAGWGIFDTGPCNLALRRGTLHHNTLGGIRVIGGTLGLDNATIAVNGNGSAGPAIDLQFGSLDILYSTIAGNDGGGSDSLTCNATTGSIRNSIVQGVNSFSIELDCFDLDMEHNALDNSNFANGTNVQVPLYAPIQFVDPANGDFRLQAPPLSPFGDIALWVDGDPLFDADGSERPTDGSLGYAGIDEPG